MTRRVTPLQPMHDGTLLERCLRVHIAETTPPRRRESWLPTVLWLGMFAVAIIILG